MKVSRIESGPLLFHGLKLKKKRLNNVLNYEDNLLESDDEEQEDER